MAVSTSPSAPGPRFSLSAEAKRREAGELGPQESETPSVERWVVQTFATVVSSLASVQSMVTASFGSIVVDQISRTGSLEATEGQLTWILTSYFVGMVFGALGAGTVGRRLGSRNVLLGMSVPAALAWIMVALAPNALFIILGRVILGALLAAGMPANLMFISGISSPSYRGLLSNIPEILLMVCGAVVFVAGKFVSWRYLGIAFGCGLNGVLALAMFFLPSDPVWLMTQGRLEDARKAILFYRGPEADTSQLKESVVEEVNMPARSLTDTVLTLRYKRNLAPLLLLLGPLTAYVWGGASTLHTYAVVFIRRLGLTIDPFYMSALISISRLPACFLSTYLIERSGRRLLLVVSSVGMAVCYCVTALYFIVPALQQVPILPVITLIGCMNFFSLGLAPITWILFAEMLPSHLRELCGGWLIIYYSLSTLVQLQTFSTVLVALTEAGVFLLWTAFALVFAMFVITALPETKGLTVEQVDNLFVDRPILALPKIFRRFANADEATDKEREQTSRV